MNAKKSDNKGEKRAMDIAIFNKLFSTGYFSLILTAVLLFCFVAMVGATNATNATSAPTKTIPEYAAIIAVIVILATFLYLIHLGYKADDKLDKGEMRRAIAGTFVVGFTVLLILSLTYDCSYRSEIVMMYIELVGIVIGFYFGQRTAETAKGGGPQ